MGEPGKGVRIGLRWRFTGWLTLITALIMLVVVTVIRSEIRSTLEQQIKARGLALARNLASSCVEPMQLPADRTLALMLFVKEYVQSGGGEEARHRLFEQRALSAEIWDYMLRFGREVETEGIHNEGVLTAIVVDPAGTIVAYADANTELMQWLEKPDHPYQPVADTGLLSPGDEFKIWNSAAQNIFLVAVPITPPAGPAPEPAAAAGPAGTAGPARPAGPQFYGAVYLSLSQGLVQRAVARAVANLILMALGLLLVGLIVAVGIAAVLTNPIRMLQQGVRAIAAGDFKYRIDLKRTDEIGELTDAFNDMAKGLAEREVMRGAFSSYVSSDLLAEIIKNPDAMKVGGARKTATVLFSIFGNHSELGGLTEKLDPEAVVGIINAYLGVQANAVAEEKGYVDKFIGDKAMAVWGATTPQPDHALLAVRCAWKIQQAVMKLNAERERQGQMTTTIAIGINTGPMVAGNMGSEEVKTDYTVIGDTVNTSARFMTSAKGGQIMIGESTFRLVKDFVTVAELPPLSVKGKTEPLTVYEITGLTAAAAR